MSWFRWHLGTCEDGKFRMIARNADVTVATVMGVWACLLEDASDPKHRGIATRGEDFYGSVLDLHDSEIDNILDGMQSAGMIDVGNGAITITNWNKRQYETDTKDATNAERQRRFREKHKQNAEQTPRNGAVTAEKRPDTDTDTDTERNPPKAPRKRVACLNADQTKIFDEWYSIYPLHKARLAAERAFPGALARASPAELLAGAARYRDECAGKEPRFIAHPATWLNQGRWKDENGRLNGSASLYDISQRRRPTAPPAAEDIADVGG